MGTRLLVATLGLLVAIAAGPTDHASAQTRELTSTDRLALLYAPQLNFTRGGDPLIRVGIVEGRKKIEFTPDREIRVLPIGEGGPEIELPGRTKYTVEISKSKAGRYKHMVIVDRVPVTRRKRVDRVKKTWMKRGYVPETVEVGGLFAVSGKVFDSRTVLVGVAGTRKLREARKIKTKLEAKYGIRGSIHSEISDYPAGLITLRGAGQKFEVRAQNVLWVAANRGEEQKIEYTIPRVPKPYGNGTETRKYTGTLMFAPDRKGRLVAMTSLGAERLLEGVVPAEIFASAPPEALKAQAVAARNEIFSAIGVRNLADPYMLRGDVMDQVYGGTGREDSRTSAAVKATRGRVMFYGDEIVQAYYSSNSGGHTENAENVWDTVPRPYLKGKADAPKGKVPKAFRDGISESELQDFLASDFPAYGKTAPVYSTKHYRWSKTVDASTAEKWLRENARDVGRLKEVKILERGVSGRIVRLQAIGSSGEAIVERELNVRRMFGGLKSGLFVMEPQKSGGRLTKISFRGAGFGHGVGMCQTGATGMADQGKNYDDILRHYYTGIEIRKLY
jgi:SpoIID/LytB domain protein